MGALCSNLASSDRIPASMSIDDVSTAVKTFMRKHHTILAAITRSEYIGIFGAHQNRQVSESQFDRIDTDGDNKNDALELFSALFICSRGKLHDKCEALFRLYDFNHDGTLTRTEMILLVRGTLRGLAKISSGRIPRLPIIEETVNQIFDGSISGSDVETVVGTESVAQGKFITWCLVSPTLRALTERFCAGLPDDAQVSIEQIRSCVFGSRSRSLGRISGAWSAGLAGGLNSTENPQYVLRLRTSSSARLVNVSIIVERTDDTVDAQPVCLYVFKAMKAVAAGQASGVSHRLIDFTGHELVNANQSSGARRMAVINTRLATCPHHYIIMVCLQSGGSFGTFVISMKTRMGVRSDITELPLTQLRYSACWSGASSNSKRKLLLRLSPGIAARIDLSVRGGPAHQPDLTQRLTLRAVPIESRTSVLVIREVPKTESNCMNGACQLVIDSPVVREGAPAHQIWLQPSLLQGGCGGGALPNSTNRQGGGRFDMVITMSSSKGGGGCGSSLSPVGNTIVTGTWLGGTPCAVPQVLLRFLSPQAGLARVQVSLHRTDGGRKEGLVVCLYRVDDPVSLVRLPSQPAVQSNFTVADSVVFAANLPTSQMYVVVPCLEHPESTGRFTLAVQMCGNGAGPTLTKLSLADGASDEQPTPPKQQQLVHEHDMTVAPTAATEGVVQLQMLPQPARLRMRGRWPVDLPVLKHPEQQQYQVTSADLALVSVDVIADDAVTAPTIFVYRGVKDILDVRRKSLDDVDLVAMATAPKGSAKVSLSFRIDPEQPSSSLIIVVASLRSGDFGISVSASQTIQCSNLAVGAPIVPRDGLMRRTAPMQPPDTPFDFDTAVKCCERDEVMFTDEVFMAGRGALGSQAKADEETFVDGVDGWMRIGDMCDDPTLFGPNVDDGICCDDMIAPCAGFSWVLEGLATLAPRGAVLLRCLFGTTMISPWGAYTVRLYDVKSRTWTTVVIDDLIPVDNVRRAAFIRCRHPSIVWIVLLVKALAKLHGSYRAMSSAHAMGIMGAASLVQALTGEHATSESLLQCPSTNDELWDRLRDLTGEVGVCVAMHARMLRDRDPTTLDTVPALALNTAYRVMGTRASASGLRLILVRRSWGAHAPFAGAWRAGSELWRPAGLTKEFAFDDVDPSSFFMDVREFREAFAMMSVCRAPRDDPFVYQLTQTGVWSAGLSGGVGAALNPQFAFSARHGAVAIVLSVPVDEPPRPLQVMLCRVLPRVGLPLKAINLSTIVSCSPDAVSSSARIELTLPVVRGNRQGIYVVVVGCGRAGESPLSLQFTLTMRCTERTALTRVAFIDTELADEVLMGVARRRTRDAETELLQLRAARRHGDAK